MNVTISPSRLYGAIQAPPSKSMGHRLLIAAGLSDGTSVIDGISDSEDMLATLDVLRALGASCEKQGNTVTVRGVDPRRASSARASCRECGSTLRFFIPICLLSTAPVTLSGSPRLFARPLGIYEDICREQGLTFDRRETEVSLCGALRAGDYRIPGDVSSQFISGLLFALPFCDGDSTLTLIPPVESRSYIDMTLSALAAFGINAAWRDELTLTVPGGQTYRAAHARVEGDCSNAAFFLALQALGMDVRVTDLPSDTHQGDAVCAEYFTRLNNGCPTLSVANCPDLAPILMAVAAAKQGCVLTDTARLRIKESDRGAAMSEELAKLGVRVDVEENRITVYGGTLHAPREPLSGHNDHRIVMALCTLLTLVGGTIRGAQAVRKSLPDYFDMLRALGAGLHIEEAASI